MHPEKTSSLRHSLLQLKLGSRYLIHVAVSSRTTAEHFDRICGMKGLLDTELYVELMRWAHILDDLVIRDSVDFTRSKAVERVGRYLFGMELALRPVSHAMQLDRDRSAFSSAAGRSATPWFSYKLLQYIM